MVLELAFLLQNGARPSAGGYRARCPLHGSDHQYSLAVDTGRGVFFCHACGARGQVGMGPGAPALPRPALPPVALDRHDVLERVEAIYRRQFPGSPAERYLEQRGIPCALAQALGAGWADGRLVQHAEAVGLSRMALEAAGLVRADGREVMAGRVVFPLTRARRRVNLYGRAVDPDAPKAWRHRFLSGPRGYFNEPAAWSEACLCEGVLDALSVLACGYPWATALCGLHGVEAGEALWEPLQTVVLALDADAPGQARSAALAEAFWQCGKQVLVLDDLGAKDLNAAWQITGRLPDLEERAGALPPDAWERVALRPEPAVAIPGRGSDRWFEAMTAMPGCRFLVEAADGRACPVRSEEEFSEAPSTSPDALEAALQVLADALQRVAGLLATRPVAAGPPVRPAGSGGVAAKRPLFRKQRHGPVRIPVRVRSRVDSNRPRCVGERAPP